MQAGGAGELVDAVAVTVLADWVAVLVIITVLVMVLADWVTTGVAVLVMVAVLVAVGQLVRLMHPPGQTWLSPIRQLQGGGLMEQTWRWACTTIVMAASSAAIMNLICGS